MFFYRKTRPVEMNQFSNIDNEVEGIEYVRNFLKSVKIKYKILVYIITKLQRMHFFDVTVSMEVNQPRNMEVHSNHKLKKQ